MIERLPATVAAPRPDAPIISNIEHLGGRGALYLLALVQGQQTRQRVAPTQEATAALLSLLDALGVVRAEPHPTRISNFTFPDKLPWTYTWFHVPFDSLEERLTNFLSATGRTELYADAWLRIWQELLPGEVIAYFQHQLRLHQFSDAFLADLVSLLVPDESRYSLGHWRYACWASARSMASVSEQHPGNMELLKFTLRNEMPRRLKIALASPDEKLCFSPPYSTTDCMLCHVFATVATSLGENFWKSPPSVNALHRNQ